MKRKAFTVKVIIVSIVIISCFIYLFYHLFTIQILRHKKLYKQARQKYTSKKTIYGQRGKIYDKNGNLLVANNPCKNIRANPQRIKSKETAKTLASYFSKKLNVDKSTIYRRLSDKVVDNRKIYEIVIKNNVSLKNAQNIREELKQKNLLKGIIFYNSSKRYYPKGKLLSNVLGFINKKQKEVIPVTGIERAYNSVLSSQKPGSIFYESTLNGVPLNYKKVLEKRKIGGKDLYLTISEPIQAIIEKHLKKLYKKWNPKAAYAVMADPETGSILAMGQYPTYNPNRRENMTPKRWRNRIVSSGFEPGSIMKPLVIAKALDLGIVRPNTKFDCENGYWTYAGVPLRDSHSYDELTVKKIVKKSSNIGTAKIALKLGEKKLYELLKDYGFGKKTSLPFKLEAKGILRKLKNWDSLSITRFPIGQGLLVSPLQLVSAYITLANYGTKMKLRIIDKIVDPEKDEVFRYPIKEDKEVIYSYWASKWIIDMMKTVTEEGGTAERASIEGYEVAGKTGTSQKWIDGKYSKTKYFASFIGFVPAKDPEFILLITVDEPKRSHYGGVVAAPAFRKIAKETLRYMEVPPEKK